MEILLSILYMQIVNQFTDFLLWFFLNCSISYNFIVGWVWGENDGIDLSVLGQCLWKYTVPKWTNLQ